MELGRIVIGNYSWVMSLGGLVLPGLDSGKMTWSSSAVAWPLFLALPTALQSSLNRKYTDVTKTK
eukprot:1798150-Ditylum_brightwellii.AAC.1